MARERDFLYSGTGNLLCLAVSESDQIGSSGALGRWSRYAISWGTYSPDYAKLAIWPGAYFLTVNLFTRVGCFFSFQGAPKVCALNRNVLLTDSPPAATSFQCSEPFPSYHSLLAADLDGSTLPGDQSTNFVLGLDFNALNFWKFKVDFSNTSNAILTGPTSIAVASSTAA